MTEREGEERSSEENVSLPAADPELPPGLMVSVGERGGFAVPVQLGGKVLVTRGR